MCEKEWLEGYSGESVSELIALENEFRIDSLVCAIEEALLEKEGVGHSALSSTEIIICAVEALEREVNNGGYDSFFLNSSRRFSPYIEDALKKIGCNEVAEITKSAIDLIGFDHLPENPKKFEKALRKTIKKNEKYLDSLNQRYFEVAGDLSAPLFSFIKKNFQDIVLRT